MLKLFVNILWGYHVLFLIFLTGIKLSFSSGFFQVRKFFYWTKECFRTDKSDENSISPFAALTTALAGSIGTGNIVGVGLAISVGGAGAIFWMWVSAFFGMMTVFYEVALAQKFKGSDIGAFSYIKKLPKGKILCFIYGTGCVLSCLAMGNMAQANSFSTATQALNISPILSGVFLAVVMFFLSKKGIKAVAKLSEVLVPLMTLFFLAMCTVIIVKFRHNLPSVINEILAGAFTLEGGLGGGMFVAMKVGISRGVFTNEAGLGLSAMAFSNVSGKNPKELGCLGIFQVFMDTIVMCSVTGICILLATFTRSDEYLSITAFGAALGDFGFFGINLCMALFAFATMSATSYYGKIGINYITRGKGEFLFPYLFAIASFVGCVLPLEYVFELSDAFNGLLAIPNIIALIFLSKKIDKVYFTQKRLR